MTLHFKGTTLSFGVCLLRCVVTTQRLVYIRFHVCGPPSCQLPSPSSPFCGDPTLSLLNREGRCKAGETLRGVSAIVQGPAMQFLFVLRREGHFLQRCTSPVTGHLASPKPARNLSVGSDVILDPGQALSSPFVCWWPASCLCLFNLSAIGSSVDLA